MRKALLAMSAAVALVAPAAAQNFPGAWPPEPYLSAAIASLNAGRSPYATVPQAEIDRLCGIRGALGCTREGPFGLFIMVSDRAHDRCVVLIHEEAHRLGWPGNHAGGGDVPRRFRCPLNFNP
jgi:hypothetical protein